MSESSAPKPRIREPDRQTPIPWIITDDSLAPDHPARVLWDVFGALDLSAFASHTKAVEGHAGRTLRSPRMMLTLWCYALSQGESSARRIEKLTHTDVAYRWIVRDIELTHHKLSDFRVRHREQLSELFTQVLGILLHKKLLSLDLVGQDGTRVRASAAASSFRGEESLDNCLEHAAVHLKTVLAQGEGSEHFAQRRAKAEDYQRRVQDAKNHLARQCAPQPPAARDRKGPPRKAKERRKKAGGRPKLAKASTTDPEARVMKMPDGGYRPAYNLQLATAGRADGGPRTIVGLLVSNLGSDMGSLTPMLEDVKARCGRAPGTWLADGGHLKYSDVLAAEKQDVRVVIPMRKQGSDEPQVPNAEVAAWRGRAKSEESKQVAKARPSLCEWSNAILKEHFGLHTMRVRGLANVMCVALLGALTLNLLQHASGLV